MAIALDSQALATAFGTNISFSFNNVAGSYMVASVMYAGGSAIGMLTNWTYNSVALTKQQEAADQFGPTDAALFTLANPGTGSHTFQGTATGSGNVSIIVAVYTFTGVNAYDVGATSTGHSLTVTTTNANEWIIDAFVNNNNASCTANSPQTNVLQDIVGGAAMNASTDGPLSQGSNTVSWTATAFAQPAYACIAISPSGASTTIFKKTLSTIGTKAGSRPVHGWGSV